MSRLKIFGPLFGVVILSILLLAFSENLSFWFASLRAPQASLKVGKVVRVQGSVLRQHGAQSESLTAGDSLSVELYDGDRLQTSADAKALVILNSQDEMDISPGGLVQLKLWNAKDPASPIYVEPINGEVNWPRLGIRGKAYLIIDGRLFMPGQKPTQTPLALTIAHGATLDLKVASKNAGGGVVGAGDFEPDTSAANELSNNAVAINETSSSNVEPETLSNEYIDEMIVSHQVQLQKCWLTRLKDVPGLKGQIVIQLEISKRGKVKDARIANSTLNDETLQKCVVSVIERVSFRPFKGAEISLSYPVNFE